MYNSRLLYEGCHDTHITPRLLHLQDPVNITTTTALYDASIYKMEEEEKEMDGGWTILLSINWSSGN